MRYLGFAHVSGGIIYQLCTCCSLSFSFYWNRSFRQSRRMWKCNHRWCEWEYWGKRLALPCRHLPWCWGGPAPSATAPGYRSASAWCQREVHGGEGNEMERHKKINVIWPAMYLALLLRVKLRKKHILIDVFSSFALPQLHKVVWT